MFFDKFQKTHNVIGPICMKTTTDMREKFVAKFLQEDNIGKILMISRTGDEGIDIPSATKMVQICTPWGSRRQHAQRIGRVQRPKEVNEVCEAISIISNDTHEVEFSKKRDEYLREMNYDVLVTTNEELCTDAEIDKAIQDLNKNESYIQKPIQQAIQQSTQQSIQKKIQKKIKKKLL